MSRWKKVCLPMLIAAFLVSACGGGSQTDATPTPAPPTRTPFPTFAFVEPTKAQAFEQQDDAAAAPAATEEPAAEAIELNPTAVQRGLGRYEALDCAGCHGAGGAGTSRVKGLLDFSLPEEDFITFVRTGGELGTRHQFSTDRLSDSGSRNLYQYLVSLAAGG